MQINNEPVAWMVEDDEDISFIMNGKGLAKPDASWKSVTPVYTHPAKTLTNAVVNELWAESQEDGIAMQQGFTTQQHYFAYLILRKASEKS